MYQKFLKSVLSYGLPFCVLMSGGFVSQSMAEVIKETKDGLSTVYNKVKDDIKPVKKIIIESPFTYDYQENSIESTAFDYALTVRTLNDDLIKQFYTEESFQKKIKEKGSLANDKWLAEADYSKFFKIILSPHILRPENYVVEVRYYHSEKYPDFGSLAEMKNINGEWKVVY